MPPSHTYLNHTVELLTTSTRFPNDLSDSLASLSVASSSAPTSSSLPRSAGHAAGLPDLPREEANEEDPTPWMEKVRRESQSGQEERTPMQLLDAEISAFVQWCRPTVAEHDFRKQVFALFERIVQRLWPGAKVELFGSMITGLYLPHGDFDVVVHHDPLHRLPTAQILRSLASALRTSSFALPSSIELVSSAKVPIAKFRTSPQYGSFRFDVSFNGPKGPAGARESMRLLAELEGTEEGGKKRARDLVMVLKALMDSLRMNEVKNGGLGGLSTLCLAVSFVQHYRRKADTSPGRDLLRFLDYYAFKFDYRKYAITTANGGGTIDKKQAGWYLPRDPIRLSIQHPVDLSRDLSSGSHDWKNILLHLSDCFDSLSAFLETASNPDFPAPSALHKLGIRFAPQALVQRRENQRLAGQGLLDEKVRNWEPDVREDPTLQRMRLNGFISVSIPLTPSPSTPSSAYASPASTSANGNGEAWSPEMARFATLIPAASTAPNPQQNTVVYSANPTLAALRAVQRQSQAAASAAASSAVGYQPRQPQAPTGYGAYTSSALRPGAYLPHFPSPAAFSPSPLPSPPYGIYLPSPSERDYTSPVPPSPSLYTTAPPSPFSTASYTTSQASRGPPVSFSSPPLPPSLPSPSPYHQPPPQAQPQAVLYGREWGIASGTAHDDGRYGGY